MASGNPFAPDSQVWKSTQPEPQTAAKPGVSPAAAFSSADPFAHAPQTSIAGTAC